MVKYWVDKKWVAVIGDESGKMLRNKDLIGWVNVTLQMDSMFSAIKDFEYKKLLEVYMQTRGTGTTKDPEIIREIFKSQGLDADRFVMEDAPDVTPQEVLPWRGTFTETPPTEQPIDTTTQDIAALANMQVDLWNEWRGQP